MPGKRITDGEGHKASKTGTKANMLTDGMLCLLGKQNGAVFTTDGLPAHIVYTYSIADFF